MTNTGRYEYISICQHGFKLPRVLCTVCVKESVLPWFDYSPLGESVTAGMECILGSAMYLKSTGMSLKKTQSAVTTLEDELNAGWESHLSSPRKQLKRKKRKNSQSCSFVYYRSWLCRLQNACCWRENSYGEKPGRTTITATVCK